MGEEAHEQHRRDDGLRGSGETDDAQHHGSDTSDIGGLGLGGGRLPEPETGLSRDEHGQQGGEQEDAESAGLDETEDDRLAKTVKSPPVESTSKPVTLIAEVAVKRAERSEMPPGVDVAVGSISRPVPTSRATR